MKSIKIGTRNSPLALWQAHEVAAKLHNLGHSTEIVPIVSSGDKNLTQPLYSMGITGVFTKDLDIALLDREIDIAVHSLKDIPTNLPQNIEIIVHLERDFPQDILIRNSKSKDKPLSEISVATSSLRRRAFWLSQFPTAIFTDIRGNVNTRLQKLEDGLADSTIFSLAGIKRLGLSIPYEELHFMLPAPAQGVVAVCGHSDNQKINSILKNINHAETEVCTTAERAFLRTMEGGCTAPIGAFAEIIGDKLRLSVRLASVDGKNVLNAEEVFEKTNPEIAGETLAQKLLANGGKEIMDEIKTHL